MATAAIAVFDIGSSSLRCTIYDVNENLNVLAHSSMDRRSVQDGGTILDVNGLSDDVERLFDDALAQQQSMMLTIEAMGFATFAMNMVGVNALGEIVATMSYASQSTASRNDLDQLKGQLGHEALAALYQATGTPPLHTSYALSHLRTAPNDEVVHWQTIASYTISRWCENLSSSSSSSPINYAEASWTGLLNIHSGAYEPRLIQLLPNPRSLPTIVPTDAPIGMWDKTSVREDYFRRWPALTGAKLFGGIPDGLAANFGSKCTVIERIAVTVGTSAAARVILNTPLYMSSLHEVPIPPGLFGYRIDDAHMLLGGALSDGGSVMEWAIRLLNLGDYESEDFQNCLADAAKLLQTAYDDASRSSSPPTTQLTMVPFLSGERSTGFRNGATGAMIGLTRETTSAHFLLSCMEGVVLRLNAIITLLRNVINAIANEKMTPIIVVSGKALETNALWRKMLADCTGLSVVIDGTTKEGTSRGVARYISSHHDAYAAEDLIVTGRTDPDQKTSYWEEASARQNALMEAVSPMYANNNSSR